MKKIRLMIIEDNRVLRDGISTMLNEQSDMHVVAVIGSGNEILLKASQKTPDIILMDLGLKSFKESSVIASIRKNMPQVKVIGMGFVPTQSDIVEFVEAGALGFILKTATVKEFLATVRSVQQGIQVLPPPLTGSLFSYIIERAVKEGKGKVPSAVRMTKREKEITALIADSLSNKEIAQQLNIATHTVKSHVHNIMEKLALHTRLQIAKFSHDERD
ncbi:MAG: DNA-binding response regulator [Ignavibacteriae bacterium]|nr:MAG: DNA-binding response regulator [Ignavibacteriota bacterium]